MRIWLALLAAPSTALLCQSALYALTTPACESQTRAALHAVAVLCLLATLAFTALARSEWKLRAAGTPSGLDSDGADRSTTQRFLAAAACAVGALSSLTIAAMWMAVWVLSPCAV